MQTLEEMLTLPEAARIARTCTNTLKAAVLAGRLTAVDVGTGRGRRYWRISRKELERFLGVGPSSGERGGERS